MTIQELINDLLEESKELKSGVNSEIHLGSLGVSNIPILSIYAVAKGKGYEKKQPDRICIDIGDDW